MAEPPHPTGHYLLEGCNFFRELSAQLRVAAGEGLGPLLQRAAKAVAQVGEGRRAIRHNVQRPRRASLPDRASVCSTPNLVTALG